MNRYNVISIHYTAKCNMSCKWCYANYEKDKTEKPREFWLNLIPYMAKFTDQIAVGGGEPFIDVEFIKEYAKTCRDNGVICNVTSNGKLLMKMTDNELKSALQDITMVSLSWDKEKIRSGHEAVDYCLLVQRIKKNTSCQVGCNYLVEDLEKLKQHVEMFFEVMGVDRVFALQLKKTKGRPDILSARDMFLMLTNKYKHFYVDDSIKMVLSEKKWSDWESPCHYLRDMVSINRYGEILGCSFDTEPIITLNGPEDLLKLSEVKLGDRHSCPYI